MKFMACLAFTHGQFMVVSLVSLIRPVFIFFMHATSEKEQFFSVWMYERLRYGKLLLCINMSAFMPFVFIFIHEIVNKTVRVWHEFFHQYKKIQIVEPQVN